MCTLEHLLLRWYRTNALDDRRAFDEAARKEAMAGCSEIIHWRQQDIRDDIVSHVMVAMNEMLSRKFVPNTSMRFDAYVRRMARNAAIDHGRATKCQSELRDAVSHGQSLDTQSVKLDRSEAILFADYVSNVCTEDEQEVLRLRFVCEMTYPQIAEYFGDRTDDAVRKQINKLLRKLGRPFKQGGTFDATS